MIKNDNKTFTYPLSWAFYVLTITRAFHWRVADHWSNTHTSLIHAYLLIEKNFIWKRCIHYFCQWYRNRNIIFIIICKYYFKKDTCLMRVWRPTNGSIGYHRPIFVRFWIRHSVRHFALVLISICSCLTVCRMIIHITKHSVGSISSALAV